MRFRLIIMVDSDRDFWELMDGDLEDPLRMAVASIHRLMPPGFCLVRQVLGSESPPFDRFHIMNEKYVKFLCHFFLVQRSEYIDPWDLQYFHTYCILNPDFRPNSKYVKQNNSIVFAHLIEYVRSIDPALICDAGWDNFTYHF